MAIEKIALIAAIWPGYIIAYENSEGQMIQPSYNLEDLKRFRNFTLDHSVVMGWNTHKAIYDRLGKPLPRRHNIVLSKSKPSKDGITIVGSIEDALRESVRYNLQNNFKQELFVIGGASVYEQFMPLATHIYLTIIPEKIPRGVKTLNFPKMKESWEATSIGVGKTCSFWDFKKRENGIYNNC